MMTVKGERDRKRDQQCGQCSYTWSFGPCKDDYTSCSAESGMLNHLLATHLWYTGEGVSDEQPVTCWMPTAQVTSYVLLCLQVIWWNREGLPYTCQELHCCVCVLSECTCMRAHLHSLQTSSFVLSVAINIVQTDPRSQQKDMSEWKETTQKKCWPRCS